MSDSRSYSGHLNVRIDPLIHRMASEMAKERGVSLAVFVSGALGYYLGAGGEPVQDQPIKVTGNAKA